MRKSKRQTEPKQIFLYPTIYNNSMEPRQVVLCTNCGDVLIRQMGITTTTCTTCNTQQKIEGMKWIERDVDLKKAQQIRQSAKRDIIGELETNTFEEIETDTNAFQTVLDMIYEHEPMSHKQLVGFCRMKHNMTIKTVEQTVEQLCEYNSVKKTDDGYVSV